MAVPLITMYDRKTGPRELKRKQKEILLKILSMHTVFKFSQAVVTNTSKYNLAEGLDLIKPIKNLLS